MPIPYGKLPVPRMTPELLALMTEGRVYSLQHTLEPGIPVFGGHAPFIMRPFLRHGETDGMLEGGAGFATELTMMSQHTGTHIDAFAHFSEERNGVRVLHDGVPVAGTQNHDGVSAWSIEQMPPIVARCVLLDVPALLGVEVLDDSYGITEADVRGCEERQGVSVRPGDCVVLRTGFTRYWKTENDRFLTRHAGATLEAARYLVEKGAIALGGDTGTFEALPSPRHQVHLYLLVEQGVPIIENLNLEELAAGRVYESVLIITPLKIKGATASVIHPIAIR